MGLTLPSLQRIKTCCDRNDFADEGFVLGAWFRGPNAPRVHMQVWGVGERRGERSVDTPVLELRFSDSVPCPHLRERGHTNTSRDD